VILLGVQHEVSYVLVGFGGEHDRWRNNAGNVAIADNAVDGERETGAFLFPPTSPFRLQKNDIVKLQDRTFSTAPNHKHPTSSTDQE
jgi:hypothetical protein